MKTLTLPLAQAIAKRFNETGVPTGFLFVDQDKQEKFYFEEWIMLVRDKGEVIEINLYHPQEGKT